MEAAGIFPAWLAQLLDQDDEECERQRESLDLLLAIADSDSDDKSAYPAGHLAGVRTNPTRALRTRVFALQLWYGADDEQFKARVRVTRTTFLRILEAIAKPGEDLGQDRLAETRLIRGEEPGGVGADEAGHEHGRQEQRDVIGAVGGCAKAEVGEQFC